MKIGVLALQGAFIEHQQIVESLGAAVRQVRLPDDLEGLDGLIIPGGESTTIGKLATDFGLIEPLRQFGRQHAIWGTCAGAIFLSKDIHRDQPLLGLMDITVERNAFGSQVESFEIDLDIPCLNRPEWFKPEWLKEGLKSAPFHAVFIRAPLIESVNGSTEVLATLPDRRIVAARQGKWLATSFHPELTSDHRFHRYFLEMSQ
ncbi:MAG TPA: pyridoxal 5'-phosphate synthase glutaminase subunit PdxT [Anaerolineaceae bacterium]